jgi:uncharacterized protein (TIGR02996 family)
MTSEEDFHAALDACPEDWQTRLVFADWLQERGDVRAEGYRALGRLRLYPGSTKQFPCWWSHPNCIGVEEPNQHGQLPTDWFLVVQTDPSHTWWEDYSRRRDAEDAAAIAFTKLPPARRAELIAGKTDKTRMAGAKRAER